MGLLGDLTNVGFDSVQAKILATAIGGGGGSTTWGNIGGTLSNQTDLQNALNAKANISSLALVATSGDYNDLLNTPTIPTVNDATLTIQKNGTNVATFTANSSSNATANIVVPTDTNDLTNGAGYITSGDIPSGDLSSNSSVLTVTDGTGATLSNTSLTLDTDLSKYDNTTSDFVDSNALATKQDVIDANNKLDYSLIANTPTIPTVNDATLTIQKNSSNVGTFTANASSNVTVDISVPTDTNDLTNGAGYITANDIPALPADTDLSHYDNSTSDFVDSNDLATKQDVIDANNPLSASYVSGLALVATSGDYDDLLNKPTIPTVNDATLTIQRNSSNVGTFTANASSNTTIDITVPTDTNDLTNGAGYITSSSLPTVNDATLTIQKNGTNVATFTANASSNATANISVPTDTSDLTNTAGYITGVSSINDIGDVTITTPSAGELLKYDGSKWINGSPSTSVTNWGDILGSLSNQTDLQSALNDKQDVIDANNKLDYSLLSNTPTIPTVNDATLTIQKNGTNVATFTANASSNATANISVPTDTSDLTNTAGYITGISNISDIGDVSITSASTNDYLQYDGSNWVNVKFTGDIGATSYNLIGTNNNSTISKTNVYVDSSNNSLHTYSIIPRDNNTYVIGESITGKKYKGAYLNNFVYVNYSSGSNPSNGDYGIINNSGYLGLAGRGGIYGGINVWGLNNVELGNWTSRGILPGASNTYDFGNNNNRWRTIYTNNNVNVSDSRIKDNIEDLENGLEKINSISVKSFTMNNHDEGVMYGFIAQDELERNPELVVVPDNYSEEEGGGELGYMPNNVLFLAVKAIQELFDKVTNLEQELKTIKGDNYGN